MHLFTFRILYCLVLSLQYATQIFFNDIVKWKTFLKGKIRTKYFSKGDLQLSLNAFNLASPYLTLCNWAPQRQPPRSPKLQFKNPLSTITLLSLSAAFGRIYTYACTHVCMLLEIFSSSASWFPTSLHRFSPSHYYSISLPCFLQEGVSTLGLTMDLIILTGLSQFTPSSLPLP